MEISTSWKWPHSPRMPDRPPGICPECQAIARNGRFCEKHEHDNRVLRASRDRNSLRRAGGLRRLYDTALWRIRTRRFILSRDALCQIAILCEGRAPSTDVDHTERAEIYIARHGGDESFFFDPANLRGACQADHSYKTALENRNAWDESLVPKLTEV
jgi:hypothetical protein